MHDRHIGKAPPLHLFHTKLDSAWGEVHKPLLTVHGCSLILRSLPPPMWPGNEATMTVLVASCYTESF